MSGQRVRSSGRVNEQLAVLLGVATLSMTGCVLREEKIRVSRDGRVAIAMEISGESTRVNEGDAMPSAASGWNVQRETKVEDDKEETTLKSERTFKPGVTLPRTFAAPDDPQADIYLDFPTTVRTERREDGLYFVFRRVYSERPWAYMQHWKDICYDDDVKKLGEKPIEELTHEQRRTIAEASICDEAFSQVELTRVALQKAEPELSVESRLIARQALLDFYATDRHQKTDRQGNVIEESHDYLDRILHKCGDLPDDDRDVCYDTEATQILQQGLDTYLTALADTSGFSTGRLAEYEEAYHHAKHYYENTEEIGGHMFKVTVILPGRIVAHNALNADVDEKNSASEMVWEFKGSVVRDRPHELIAVSMIPWDELDREEGNASER